VTEEEKWALNVAVQGVLDKPSVHDPGFIKFRRGHWNDVAEARRVVANAFEALLAAGYSIAKHGLEEECRVSAAVTHPHWYPGRTAWVPRCEEPCEHQRRRRHAASEWEVVAIPQDADRG
jgi:hypothetical protein